MLCQAQAPTLIARKCFACFVNYSNTLNVSSFTGYVHHHIFTAVLTIFMDVFNDIDKGLPEEASRSKLANIPAVIAICDADEQSGMDASVEVRYMESSSLLG